MKTSKWMAIALLLAACGPANNDEKDANNATTTGSNNGTSTSSNNGTSATNNGTAATNNGTVDPNNETTSTNNIAAPEAIECASMLVSSGGNYYALEALLTVDGPEVQMVYHRAATPTSDPEEAIVFSELVPGQLTALQFSFETQETSLFVERDADEGYYRGTMTGTNEFEGDISVVCWEADVAFAASYDAATGKCVDDAGAEARNELEWMHVASTGFGQCGDFSGQLNGDAFGYPTFDKLDLRGSTFAGAKLDFANLTDSQMEGVDFTGFEPNYATIGGTIDAYTVLPGTDCEPTDGTSFECIF